MPPKLTVPENVSDVVGKLAKEDKTAAEIAKLLLEQLEKEPLPAATILNVNVILNSNKETSHSVISTQE